MGFGREGAICEYIEIMQILPGSSDECGAYKCIGAICNIAKAAARSAPQCAGSVGSEAGFFNNSTSRLRPR